MPDSLVFAVLEAARAAPIGLRAVEETLDGWAEAVHDVLVSILFVPVLGVPFIVLWLLVGGVVCTAWMGFINIRGFGHALQVVRGRFDGEADPDAGEVTHRQALSSALSATVGLGNIAGVAIAVSVGGPGATFWMILAGLFGMTLKFTECTLGQMYRKVDDAGRISGGPMHYLRDGLAEQGWGRLGMVLSGLFVFLCLGCSLSAGNMFQVNQSLNAVARTIPALEEMKWLYGVILAAAVGIVILGGIRRIATAAERIVPLMGTLYVAMGLIILAKNATEVPQAMVIIVRSAFEENAAYGGFLGTLVTGIRRAVFSSEAGAGSAAIAHSAARTKEPVREGIVALLEPFIDTVVVCTMTALVIVVTGAYLEEAPEFMDARQAQEGARLTSLALGREISWFPPVLSVVVVLFAFSTIITWSYYGERCARHVFGPGMTLPYRLISVAFVVLGSLVTATNVKNLSDLMVLGMAFPNLLGIYFLLPRVRRALDHYWRRYGPGTRP